jgi:hypothetical protein
MPVRDFWDREEPTVVDEATVGRVAKSEQIRSRQKRIRGRKRRPTGADELAVDEHPGTRLRGQAVGVVPDVHDAS